MQAKNFKIIKQKKFRSLRKKFCLETIVRILIITIVMGNLWSVVKADSFEQKSRIVAKPGDTSEVVKEIQEILLALDFTSQKVTGYYGQITENNILFFQKDVQVREKNRILGLDCTGIVDDKTYSALMIEKERIGPKQLTYGQELELEMGLISCLEQLSCSLGQLKSLENSFSFDPGLRNYLKKNHEETIIELRGLIISNTKLTNEYDLNIVWYTKDIRAIQKIIERVKEQYPNIENEQKKRNNQMYKSIVSFTIDVTNIPGFLKSINEVVEGTDLMTGRQLSLSEQGVNLVLSAIPFVGGMAKDGKTVLKACEIGKAVSRADDIQKIKSIALLGKGDKLEAFWKKLIPVRGYTDVIVHGNTKNVGLLRNGKWIYLDHRDLATYISKSTDYKNGPIRLVSCYIGKKFDVGFAQDLANKLGVEVVAPSDKVWLKPDGYTVIGQTPNKNTGCWRIYFPYGKKPPPPK